MTITLVYKIPQSLQKYSVQSADLLAVALVTSGTNNELTMLGDIFESAPRVVALVAGPPAELSLTITYTDTPAFLSYFPTLATQIQAVNNLWTQRIGMLLRTRCTALAPVITP